VFTLCSSQTETKSNVTESGTAFWVGRQLNAEPPLPGLPMVKGPPCERPRGWKLLGKTMQRGEGVRRSPAHRNHGKTGNQRVKKVEVFCFHSSFGPDCRVNAGEWNHEKVVVAGSCFCISAVIDGLLVSLLFRPETNRR